MVITKPYSLNFQKRYSVPRLDNQGEGHSLLLDQFIREQPNHSIIALDLHGLKYLGYSYAKATIRQVLLRRNAGEYCDRKFFLVADQGQQFLDGINAALCEKELFMLVSSCLEYPTKACFFVGSIPDYVQSTFEVLRSHEPIPTGELAHLINQSPQNTKKRLDRLHSMGLLRREKVPSPSGGLEWLNYIF